jgi:mono/diheme cytochrome c family protein
MNALPRPRSLMTAALVLTLSAAATAWLSAQGGEVFRRDEGWMASADAAAKLNPLASHPELAAGGRKLYLQKCATCHADDGRGTSRAPDLGAADVQAQSEGALFWKISSGNARTGMPAFSFLPELQRWQLVLQLRAMSSRDR